MAVYTPLCRSQLDEAARVFRLGRIISARGVPAGTINTLYDLRTKGGRYFLRILEDRSARAADFERALLEHLEGRVPVPRMVEGKRGKIVRFGPRQHLSVFHYVQGRELDPGSIDSGHARQVGEFVADMHLAQRGFRRRLQHGFSPPKMQVLMRKCLNAGLPSGVHCDAQEIARELAHHRWSRDLPGGVIHGDLFTDNVRFVRNRLACVLDFEMAGNGPWVYDLAVAVCEWAFVGASFRLARARAVVAGYQGRRTLTSAERGDLYRCCLFVAARFATTRVFDFEVNRDPNVERKIKDYREYLRRLRTLRGIGARPFNRQVFAHGVTTP